MSKEIKTLRISKKFYKLSVEICHNGIHPRGHYDEILFHLDKLREAIINAEEDALENGDDFGFPMVEHNGKIVRKM